MIYHTWERGLKKAGIFFHKFSMRVRKTKIFLNGLTPISKVVYLERKSRKIRKILMYNQGWKLLGARGTTTRTPRFSELRAEASRFFRPHYILDINRAPPISPGTQGMAALGPHEPRTDSVKFHPCMIYYTQTKETQQCLNK